MKYTRFEELPVWQEAMGLAVGIMALTSRPTFAGQSSLRSQIERGTTQKLLTFLYIARGSTGEVRSMLCLLERLPAFGDLKSQIADLNSPAEGISRQLRAWAESLQNSPIRGQRYLTENARKLDRAQKQREQFLQELRRVQEGQ